MSRFFFIPPPHQGSIHSSIELSDDCSGSIGLREDFAKECFETLLEFSLLKSTPEELSKMGSDVRDAGNGGDLTPTLTSKLAITSLLQRFKEVLVEAIDGKSIRHEGNLLFILFLI